MVLHLPQSFASSISAFGSYPENLIHRTTYHGVSSAYRNQLDDKDKTLFARKDADINVPFRDWVDASSGSVLPRAHQLVLLMSGV